MEIRPTITAATVTNFAASFTMLNSWTKLLKCVVSLIVLIWINLAKHVYGSRACEREWWVPLNAAKPEAELVHLSTADLE